MLDSLGDKNGQLLNTLVRQFLTELPSFTKSATLASETPAEDTSPALYGDPILKKFPCHTRGSAFISNLYFHGQDTLGVEYGSGGLDKQAVSARLGYMARQWGIADDVKAMTDAMTKAAGAARDAARASFGMIVDHDGRTIRKFPLHTGDLIAKSAGDLYSERFMYPYAWRKMAAGNIIAAAAKNSVDLGGDAFDYLVKAAGLLERKQEDAVNGLREYAFTFDKLPVRSRIRSAADVLEKNAGVDRVSLCAAVDAVGRRGHRHRPLPEEILFDGAPAKTASVTPVMLPTGASYDIRRVKAAGIGPIVAACGDDVALRIADATGDVLEKEAMEVLPTISVDAAATLESVYSGIGMTPLKPAMSKTAGATEEQLKDRTTLEGMKRMALEKKLVIKDNPTWSVAMSLS